ncbi:uncharacterized protein LOC128669292 [Plodia interpunctella]|uniref:uncharacterized protein LOC128669292 n=1 Tax=Plodia interpunctella TaxID=58824 RepID=UPI002367F054|nr:uncharacterized protein LOC128669292 [Plodia interpunctella]
MSDEYRVQNIHRYTRKTYKNARSAQGHDVHSPRENGNIEISELSPRSEIRSDGFAYDPAGPGCSCDIDQEADIANILHKKCPVINLAQQQLHRLLDETDKLLSENPHCCRSLYDCFCYFRELLLKHQKYVIFIYIGWTFLVGLIMGAATCGSFLGRFNSPILTCIDNFFIPDQHMIVHDAYSIV